MPFILVDDFDEPSVDVTPEELSKIIVAAVSEQITARTQEALDAALYIKQPSGVKVCRLTGRIVD